MVTDYPGQVQCILLRNTSATDPEDKFPYNTKGFQGLNESTYMFFKVSVSLPLPLPHLCIPPTLTTQPHRTTSKTSTSPPANAATPRSLRT